jgi:two-component system, cell cycle sensor histidine kinase and response regulator CckA
MHATRSLRLTAYVAVLVIAIAAGRRRGAVRSRSPLAPPTSEHDYRLLFESSPVPMWIYDLQTLAILEVNEATLARYGHSRDEFLALTMNEIEPGLRPGVAPTSVDSEGARHVTREGGVIEVRTISHDVTFLRRPARFVLAEDVGDRDRLDGQLRQAQRMEAIGRFASGVEHDFNNLVMVMTGHSDLLLANTPSDDARRGQAEEIRKAAGRAAALTGQFLALGTAPGAESVVLDLNAIVAGLEPSLRRLTRSNVEIEIARGPGVTRVRANRGQIEQVLENLAVNAGEAMPAGGTVTIATTDADLDADYFRDHPASDGEPGRYVVLTVADTGVGMDALTMSHVFDPFYTTKADGNGAGLGLATVYAVAAQSRGFVWAYSEPGHGTAFKVYLPAAQADMQPARRLGTPLAAAGRTVLLVEDDPVVRAGVRRMLEAEGFAILEAAEGVEALALSDAGDADSLSVLITDTILPGPGGVDLAHRVRHRHPALRTVIMSGYPEEQVTTGGRGLGPRTEFLAKPFTAADLHAKLAILLLEPH